MALSPRQRRAAARALASRLKKLPQLRRSRSVAAYAAIGAELSLQPFMQIMAQRRKRVYLPRIRGKGMQFHAACRRLRKNQRGIAEPHGGRPRPPWAMDTILLPLVGVDRQGNRLGQGGGYYDRWLSGLRFRRPLLLGIAHDCQIVEHIPSEPWDIPLDGLITPTQTLYFQDAHAWPTG